MMPQNISFAIGIKSMARSSHVDCAPWAFGTSLPHRLHLDRMALPNGWSGRSVASAWIISSFLVRRIYAGYCDPTHAIITTSERIGHWTKTRRPFARFSGLESSVHTRYSADFIITTSGVRFSVRTGFGV